MSHRSGTIGAFAVVLVLAVTFGIAVRSLRAHTDSDQTSKSAASNEAMMPMPLIAPLFVANSDFRSTLVLVNSSGASASADVALRASDGVQLATQHVTLVAYSQQEVGLDTLLADKGIGSAIGSIVVTPDSELKGPSILAALSMTYLGSREGNFIDEELAMPMPTDSQTLRAVTDSSTGSPLIAVSSLADTPQHVTIQCFGSSRAGASKTVALGAGQTVLTDACSPRALTASDPEGIWNSHDAHRSVTAVALASDGMPGSFAAFGLSPHQTADDRHFSSLTFADPKMLMSGTTIFTGVPAGDASALPGRTYAPQISVANFSAKPAHVTVQYAVSSGDTPVITQVWAGAVPAGGAKSVAIRNIPGDPGLQGSFIVSSSAPPGDVIAKATAETDDGMQEVEVLGKDAKVFENGGGHPWSLQGDTESTLVLFNHSDQTQKVLVMLSTDGGGAPWTKTYTLESMQTQQISISDLIQNRTKDDSGRLVPANATSGMVDWFSFNQGVKGRILQTDASSGMARNFSCGQYADVAGAQWTGAVSAIPWQASDYEIGYAEAILDLVFSGSCTGSYATTTQAYSYDYTSNASGTESVVNPTSDTPYVDGNSAGNATITGTITDTSTGCHASAETSNSVVSVTITRNISGPVSSDDSAGSEFQLDTGSTSLGTFIAVGQTTLGCAAGIETVGTVSPSNFSGNIIIQRILVNQGLYEDSTDTGGELSNHPDTSDPSLQDQNPQSGGSAGKVYDLDAPGLRPSTNGNTYRIRDNFYVWATLADGTTSVSSNYYFYVRESCKWVSAFPNYQFVNDVSGDNQTGTGTTNTTWNLQ